MNRLALFLIAALFSFAAYAAPPTLGADCGVGATIEASSTRNAGKLTIGVQAPPLPDTPATCTLSGLSWPGGKEPSCFAQRDVSPTASDPGNGQPGMYAALTTATTVTIVASSNALDDMAAGDVVSYGCVGR